MADCSFFEKLFYLYELITNASIMTILMTHFVPTYGQNAS